MKTRISTLLASSLFLLTSSFSLASGLYLPVYSYDQSTSPLHVQTFQGKLQTDNAQTGVKSWTFPASYTGHRSVCWLPGADTNMAFVAWVGGDEWAPGDPFGFSAPSTNGDARVMALTRTSSVTPRIKLWEAASSDRVTRFGLEQPTNTTTATIPTAQDVRVRVIRLSADQYQMSDLVLDYEVLFDKTFSRGVRNFIHEGDFLGDGEYDIDWTGLEDVLELKSIFGYVEVTNMAYAVVFGDGNIERTAQHPHEEILAHPVLVTRRFEATRTAPTAVSVSDGNVCRTARPTFRWRIDGEDKWASAYGTTYTAFRVRVWDSSSVLIYDSGLHRMPPIGSGRVYSWTPPADVIPADGSYTWRVFTYNAKFKADDVGSVASAFTANLGTSASAAPAKPRGIYLPVYSYLSSTNSPLHIRTMTEDVFTAEKSWTFPASYTGHRSVCWLPGADTNMSFVAWVGGDEWAPGDPFGFSAPSTNGETRALALTRTSAITPRIKLWQSAASDRITMFGLSQPTNSTTATVPTTEAVRVRVIRLSADRYPMSDLGLDYELLFDKTFSRGVRDFLGDGEFDIDWLGLSGVVELKVDINDLETTNMAYAVVFGDGNIERDEANRYKEILAHPILVTRRYEKTRTAPTAVSVSDTNVCRTARPTFRWRIDGEDKWASAYGTTYTAFRVRVWNSSSVQIYDSGLHRMPPATSAGVYSWTPPVDVTTAAGTYTWRVFTYNSKFKTDDVGSAAASFQVEN